MRFHGFLLGLVLLIVALVALANLDTLGRAGSINLPFLGVYAMPTRLIGLLSIVVVALAFWFAASLLSTSARARRADDLKRIDALRTSLDSQEASRFAALQASLDAHARALMTRLETLRPAEPTPGSVGPGSVTAETTLSGSFESPPSDSAPNNAEVSNTNPRDASRPQSLRQSRNPLSSR